MGRPAARIDALHAAGKLTDALAAWAHLVRLDGNDATHEEKELSEAEIEQLRQFSKLFLTYSFTLPSKVATWRKAAESDVEPVGQG